MGKKEGGEQGKEKKKKKKEEEGEEKRKRKREKKRKREGRGKTKEGRGEKGKRRKKKKRKKKGGDMIVGMIGVRIIERRIGIVCVLVIVAFRVLLERKILGLSQSRSRPITNR